MIEDVYIKNANIPARYLKDVDLKPSKSDCNVFKEIKNIIDDVANFVSQGQNLLLCSNYSGNGKTTIAIKILKAYINSVSDKAFKYNCPALFVNVPNIMNDLKIAISDPEVKAKTQDIEQKILSAKLVVFDDICEKLSDFELQKLYCWIETRTSNLKTCIYTSNQLEDEINKSLTGKLASRILGYSIIKVFTDKDHRGAEW